MRIDALGAAPFGRDQPLVLIETQGTCGDGELVAEIRNGEAIAIVAMFNHGISR
jgi:hypothetical protein